VQVVEHPLEPHVTGEAFEVLIGRGRIVRVPAKFDPESLKRLLCILEERC
jgi:hypothetical protein